MTDTVTRFGSAACAAIASLAGLFLFCPAASAEQTASTAFSGNGIPEGWTSVKNTLVSPAYSNSATKISISYAPSGDTKGSVRISSGESNLATLSTDTSSAEMTFPETTDFRRFSISAENASLLSFTAHYLDSRLASIPKINIDSYTPNSVSLSWDAIPDAGGYSVSIFTNTVEGASEGAKTWDDYNNATDGENGFDKTNVCRRETKEASLAGIELAPGNTLVIRFVPDGVKSGEALGIDNLSLRCNAEEIVKPGFFLHLANKK